MDILEKYEEIMKAEAKLRASKNLNYSDHFLPLERPPQMRNITYRLLEIAENSTILRSGNITGQLTKDFVAFESDGAHTNLFRSMVKYALDSRYGWGVSSPNYDRSEIDEAITLHDLPENITGDIPDNRNRDETNKLRIENEYIDKILNKYVPSQYNHCWNIRRLLQEMQEKSSPEGRTLYTADKVSAIIMMLCYDKLGLYPGVRPSDKSIAKVDRTEVGFCKKQSNGRILLSELWTIDFLYGREIVQYDDTGYFLAILVMATLLIHGKWYDWREAQYLH